MNKLINDSSWKASACEFCGGCKMAYGEQKISVHCGISLPVS